ncbi:MAG: zf-TFIIB domain-containing protein [Sterolibacteriaceae bacterium]|nr:zf-TFIIB domain-containing protein [Candidatus Methylophosphatis haderslevensis]
MTKPLCPNCREPLSSAEFGLGGIWSCLYCEGTWLSADQLAAEIDRNKPNEPKIDWQVRNDSGNAALRSLICPSCKTFSFFAMTHENATAHCCSICRGLFLPKELIMELAPRRDPGLRGAVVVGGTVAEIALWIVASVVTGGFS